MSSFSTPNLNETKRKTVLQLRDFRLKVQQHFLLFHFKSLILNTDVHLLEVEQKYVDNELKIQGTYIKYFKIKLSILTTFYLLNRENILVLIYFPIDHNVFTVYKLKVKNSTPVFLTPTIFQKALSITHLLYFLPFQIT